ncbi:MAG: T9SS type A sorting domain-containing protein [Flavobacteriales bacterium]|nr:T9SS type A sorting domain-containing protein [Flavobacteriales bacterium]
MKTNFILICMVALIAPFGSWAQLTDCYDAANWTINTAGTSGSVTISETSIDMVGDGDFDGTGLDFIDCANTNGTVSACLTIPVSGDITFDWASGNFLTNPLIDRFGYCLNGVATQLNSLDGGPFGTNDGTETISVTAGDELCFVYASLFADASAPATINNFVLTACPPPPPLSDCYDAANWTINTTGTSGSVTISETSIDMVGDGDFAGTGLDSIDCANTTGTVSACLIMPASGEVTFDWSAGNFLTNPLIDRFGYCLNGVATQLNSLDGGPFGTNDGTETITVNAGDELCFVYASLFADASAPASISNFILPACPLTSLVDCYEPANWSSNTSGTSGSVTISETSIDMVGDGDFDGTGLDFIDCANTNGTVSACLTIPVSGDFTFDWAAGNFLTNPLIDRFGYCLNGVATQLNSLDGGPFGTNDGTETISVSAGDELCFVYASLFADASAPATINNFALTPCPGPVDCSVFDTAPVDLTKSFAPVPFPNGNVDRVQVKWYKASPQVRYSDEDAAACDIKAWAKRNLDPTTGNPIGPVISNPDTLLLEDVKKSNPDGSPRELFKWPLKFRADGANNTKRVDPNIRYEWQVRCACEHGSGQESPWSVVKVFNTPNFDPSTGIYEEPSIVDGTDNSDAKIFPQINDLKIFPNPSNGSDIYLQLGSEVDSQLTVTIVDMTGKIVHSELLTSSKDTAIRFSLSQQLSAGLYVVEIQDAISAQRAQIMIK